MKYFLIFLTIGIILCGCNKSEKNDELVQRGLSFVEKKDYAKAMDLFQQSCQKNNVWGCFNLGVMYESGQGVVRDINTASIYWKKLVKIIMLKHAII